LFVRYLLTIYTNWILTEYVIASVLVSVPAVPHCRTAPNPKCQLACLFERHLHCCEPAMPKPGKKGGNSGGAEAMFSPAMTAAFTKKLTKILGRPPTATEVSASCLLPTARPKRGVHSHFITVHLPTGWGLGRRWGHRVDGRVEGDIRGGRAAAAAFEANVWRVG
jgi:hypothetical protein